MAKDLFKTYNINQGSPSSGTSGSSPSSGQMANTFLGKMPNNSSNDFMNEDNIKDFLGDALSMVGGGMALKGGKAALPLIKKGVEYLQPAKKAAQFMEQLGGGAKTAEENIEQLAKRMGLARSSAEKEALIPKKELFSQEGKNEIYQNKDLGLYKNLEEPDKYYGIGLKELHKDFTKSPTLENSDYLRSGLGKELRKLQRKENIGTLDTNGSEKLDFLKRNRKALINDQEEFIKTLPEEKQNLYNTFNEKWTKNVAPYDALGAAIRKLSKGKSAGVKPSIVKSKFSNPSEEAQKIMEDLGSSGKGNVLYNELQSVDPKDIESLAKAIMEAKRVKGYQKYVNPEIEGLSQQLEKQLSTKKTLSNIGTGLAGGVAGGALGHPIAGAILALGAKGGKNVLAKYLSKYGKK